MKRHYLTLLMKTIVSVAFLTIVFQQVDLIQAWENFQDLDPVFIIYALIFYGCLQWLSCIRWQVILSLTGYHLATYQLIGSYFAGMFLNIFLPGALGGDIYRVYQVTKSTNDSEAALVSVFLERFTGLVALSTMALIGLVPAIDLIGRHDIVALFLGCVAALVGGTLAIASPQLLMFLSPILKKLRLIGIMARMAKIQSLLIQFIQHRETLLMSMGLSLLLQIAIVYYHYLIVQQLGISISFFELLVFIPIVVVITMLPISLGGLGLKEGLWVYLFVRTGSTADQALLLSLTLMILSWLLSLPGAIILLLNTTRWKKLDSVSMSRSVKS